MEPPPQIAIAIFDFNEKRDASPRHASAQLSMACSGEKAALKKLRMRIQARKRRSSAIIEFSLKPGVDLRDDSRPPRRLLDATLRYISSITGCRGIEWGLRVDVGVDAEASFFCLIYWDSVVAWHKFQHSLGFTPLVALLASDVSNRCAKFAGRIPGALELGEAVRTNAIIDVASVTFSAQEASSHERRLAFEEKWNALVTSLTDGDGDNGLLHSHVMRLENNASTFADPSPAEAAAANVSATFTAFLAWDGINHDIHRAEHLCDSLQTSLLPSSRGNEPPSILRKSVQLINRVQPQESHDLPQQSPALLTSLVSILQGDFPRQCSADLFNLREHARHVLDRSISDARARTRLFPLPQGYFTSQGELHEGSMSVIPEWRSRQAPWGHYLVDIAWMQLKRHSVRTHGPRIYNQIKNDVGALPGFVKAFWARDVEDDTKFAILPVWGSQHAQRAVSHDSRRMLDDFVASSPHISSPLTYQSFPIARDHEGSTGLDRVECLELIWFNLPPGALERQLFEHAYGVFTRMTVPSQQGGIPAAVKVSSDLGGWQPAEATESSDSQTFTAALAWMSPAARQEWYGELLGASLWSYELFGHKLDALKMLATGGVSGRFLAMQRS
ncbi:uncharacterized protein Triagg1_3679 [Trichoderma aggressivum f. europaeum]|uniref:Uncharacterized protein n=1 Tax=Trichoderma aggressivum f. europaeum TaxID=173218 RepID=A0AAE1IGV5_9HYPO|nr:hypothetical protein Triagg1_3679 [Trichoderma aggressivum f. europaeum]